jgi:hypothetical protein
MDRALSFKYLAGFVDGCRFDNLITVAQNRLIRIQLLFFLNSTKHCGIFTLKLVAVADLSFD